LDLQEVDRTQVAVVGGKAAHLGELWRIDGVRVPAGFCVTTDALRRITAQGPAIDDRLDRLSLLEPEDRQAIHVLSAEIRQILEGIAIPEDLAAAVNRSLTRLDERAAYAVRSSATAEDSPTASFAGQQDTYLNVRGPAAILEHVSRCWASLFTERRAGRAARAARPPDRGALRAPAGHRVVPGRRRIPDRAEPPDHHGSPSPRPAIKRTTSTCPSVTSR
jgi:phosphoenolpyruvate synthase/pyruvate phosphate dikinase